MTGRAVAVLACLAGVLEAGRGAQARAMSGAETAIAVEALARSAATDLSEDPSCKDDLASAGRMSVAQGLSRTMLRAVTDRSPVVVTASCSIRTGYPVAPGQEHCRLAFRPTRKRADGTYGLAFLIDWPAKAVVAGTVECF